MFELAPLELKKKFSKMRTHNKFDYLKRLENVPRFGVRDDSGILYFLFPLKRK
jgi:hypothetical protein